MCFSLFLSCMLFVELKLGDLQFLTNLENFLLFSQILFSASPSFFPFIRAPITYTLFYRSLRLYSFFPQSFYSQCFSLDSFYCNVFTFFDPLSSVVSNLLLVPFSVFFISKIFVCIFYIFHWSSTPVNFPSAFLTYGI